MRYQYRMRHGDAMEDVRQEAYVCFVALGRESAESVSHTFRRGVVQRTPFNTIKKFDAVAPRIHFNET